MSFLKYINTILINRTSGNLTNLFILFGIILITGYFINKHLNNY